MVFVSDSRFCVRSVCIALVLCWSASAGAASAPRLASPKFVTSVANEGGPARDLEAALQEEVDALRSRLSIPVAVSASIVEVNPLLVSVEASKDAAGAFLLSFERRFLANLTADELRAVIAHELGHVWIFTHHPYLQTERLANDVAMRVVSRESLEHVYAKVWQQGGTRRATSSASSATRVGTPRLHIRTQASKGVAAFSVYPHPAGCSAGACKSLQMGGCMRRALSFGKVMLALAFAFAVPGSASAQVINGEVFGRVTDQTDAVLPGATITLTGPALIQPMTVVAAESGGYRFARVPIGTYTRARRAARLQQRAARGHHRPGRPQRRAQPQAEPSRRCRKR